MRVAIELLPAQKSKITQEEIQFALDKIKHALAERFPHGIVDGIEPGRRLFFNVSAADSDDKLGVAVYLLNS